MELHDFPDRHLALGRPSGKDKIPGRTGIRGTYNQPTIDKGFEPFARAARSQSQTSDKYSTRQSSRY